MYESEIEQAIVKKVKAMGGRAYKWTGTPGAPDRIIILPGGRVIFVEIKRPTGRLAIRQQKFHKTLEELGCTVWCVYSVEELECNINHLIIS